MQLSHDQKPATLADLIRAAVQPRPHKTIAQLAADGGLKPWHINKILGGRNIHLTVDVYEGFRKALGLSRKAMDEAVAAQKAAMTSSPFLNKSHKGLAVSGKDQKQ